MQHARKLEKESQHVRSFRKAWYEAGFVRSNLVVLKPPRAKDSELLDIMVLRGELSNGHSGGIRPQVILKVAHADNSEELVAEASRLQSFGLQPHANIPRLASPQDYSYWFNGWVRDGTKEGQGPVVNLKTKQECAFIAIECLPGKTLGEYIDGGSECNASSDYGSVLPLTWLSLIKGLANVVSHIHDTKDPEQKRGTHGDLSLGNVLYHSGHKQLWLIDLGSGSRFCAGTPPFASPSRCALRPPTHADDVYSVAALLCVLMGGLTIKEINSLPGGAPQLLIEAAFSRLEERTSQKWREGLRRVLESAFFHSSLTMPTLALKLAELEDNYKQAELVANVVEGVSAAVGKGRSRPQPKEPPQQTPGSEERRRVVRQYIGKLLQDKGKSGLVGLAEQIVEVANDRRSREKPYTTAEEALLDHERSVVQRATGVLLPAVKMFVPEQRRRRGWVECRNMLRDKIEDLFGWLMLESINGEQLSSVMVDGSLYRMPVARVAGVEVISPCIAPPLRAPRFKLLKSEDKKTRIVARSGNFLTKDRIAEIGLDEPLDSILIVFRNTVEPENKGVYRLSSEELRDLNEKIQQDQDEFDRPWYCVCPLEFKEEYEDVLAGLSEALPALWGVFCFAPVDTIAVIHDEFGIYEAVTRFLERLEEMFK